MIEQTTRRTAFTFMDQKFYGKSNFSVASNEYGRMLLPGQIIVFRSLRKKGRQDTTELDTKQIAKDGETKIFKKMLPSRHINISTP